MLEVLPLFSLSPLLKYHFFGEAFPLLPHENYSCLHILLVLDMSHSSQFAVFNYTFTWVILKMCIIIILFKYLEK